MMCLSPDFSPRFDALFGLLEERGGTHPDEICRERRRNRGPRPLFNPRENS